jgi:hypothetical protein
VLLRSTDAQVFWLKLHFLASALARTGLPPQPRIRDFRPKTARAPQRAARIAAASDAAPPQPELFPEKTASYQHFVIVLGAIVLIRPLEPTD